MTDTSYVDRILIKLSEYNAAGQAFSLDELKGIVQGASAEVDGKVSAFYSNVLIKDGTALEAGDIVKYLGRKSADIKTIAKTEIYRLLIDPAFTDAFNLTMKREGIIPNSSIANDILNGSGTAENYTKGIWDIPSELFAKAATGDVLAVVPFGDKARIWFQTELPALLKNPNVTSINGIPIDILTAIKNGPEGIIGVFNRIASQSLIKRGQRHLVF